MHHPKDGYTSFLYYFLCLCNLIKDRLSVAPFLSEASAKVRHFLKPTKYFFNYFSINVDFFIFLYTASSLLGCNTLLYIRARPQFPKKDKGGFTDTGSRHLNAGSALLTTSQAISFRLSYVVLSGSQRATASSPRSISAVQHRGGDERRSRSAYVRRSARPSCDGRRGGRRVRSLFPHG